MTAKNKPKTVRRAGPAKWRRLEQWRQQHMPYIAAGESKEMIFRRIAQFLPRLDWRYKLIEKAHGDAEKSTANEYRDSGVRYIEHLHDVVLILIAYCEVRDYVLIIAALLHDIVEMDPEWTIQRVRNEYGEEVALLVDYMTEPKDGEFGSRAAAKRTYLARWPFAPRRALLLKFADRLPNLLTLRARPLEKQISKVDESVRYYYPLAREHLILFPELRDVLRILGAPV